MAAELLERAPAPAGELALDRGQDRVGRGRGVAGRRRGLGRGGAVPRRRLREKSARELGSSTPSSRRNHGDNGASMAGRREI